jgi:hypothetical protein
MKNEESENKRYPAMILLGMGRPAGQRETALAVIKPKRFNFTLDVNLKALRRAWIRHYFNYYAFSSYDLAPQRDTDA